MNLAHDMQLINGLIGGLLIGFSALMLLLFQGKIAGISGIVGQAISRPRSSLWQWVFVVGLLMGAGAFMLVNGSLEAELPSLDTQTAIAAALIGVGTRLGMGCTSGHGVCGIGRRSPRSLVATCVFMLVAIVTVALLGR